MKQDEISERLSRIELRLIEQQPKPLTLEEAAHYLDVSKSEMYRLTSKSVLPHSKPGGKKIFFRKADLDAYLLHNRVKPLSEIRKEGDR
jgi:excisionase family DNA binding protein